MTDTTGWTPSGRPSASVPPIKVFCATLNVCVASFAHFAETVPPPATAAIVWAPPAAFGRPIVTVAAVRWLYSTGRTDTVMSPDFQGWPLTSLAVEPLLV